MTEANQLRIGRELRTLRHAARRSIVHTAFWLGVSTGHLSNVENGFSALSTEQEATLRAFYGERIRELLPELHDALSNSLRNSGL